MDELEHKSRRITNGLTKIPEAERARNRLAVLKSRYTYLEHREHKGRLMYDELDEYSKKLAAAYAACEEPAQRLKP